MQLKTAKMETTEEGEHPEACVVEPQFLFLHSCSMLTVMRQGCSLNCILQRSIKRFNMDFFASLCKSWDKK